MTYFAIRTEPGRLPAVRRLLRKAGHDCYLPAEVRMNHKRRKRIIVPIMPYLFVKAPDKKTPIEVVALWRQSIIGTRYVKTFVLMAGEPAPVYDASLDLLRKAIKETRFEAEAAKAGRHIGRGMKVIAKHGPFAGKKGTVVWTQGRRAKWETILFGREVTVEAQVKDLEVAA